MTSATVAPSDLDRRIRCRRSTPPRVRRPPRETGAGQHASATTGHAASTERRDGAPDVAVTAKATSALGIDSRLTPRSARSLGQAISRSPGTSTKR